MARRGASALRRAASAVVALLTAASAAAPSQGPPRDTLIAAGPHYAAGWLHRLFFGSDYRAFWATPIRAPLLDLATFGGGLTPTTAGFGRQTRSLRFRGGDGREYGFRSVDKEADVLPPELEGTVVDRLVQDQTSSALPVGPALVAPLMEAVGILHAAPRLVVLPDDSRLGEFRERFRGALGFIEARALALPGTPAFAGADEIIRGPDLFTRADSSHRERVDPRALLRARLFDLFIGDWDRHRDQWRWARFGDARITRWVPIPEDRDQAFARYDGLMLGIARRTAPEVVNFGPRYPSLAGLTWVGRDLDRRFLVELERPAWDSVAAALTAGLTNSVIDAAAAALPPEYRAIDRGWLARTLKARRDRLADVAARHYRLLLHDVDLRATAEPDRIALERAPDGAVTAALSVSGETYFRRRFDPRETRELRVYSGRGADTITVRGAGPGRITIRLIASGDDVAIDSSRAGGVRLYGSAGDRSLGPGRVRIDRRPFTPPGREQPTELVHRDWGARTITLFGATYAPDVGVLAAWGGSRRSYGFRKVPYASRVRWLAAYATEARTGRLDLGARWYRTNSRVRFELDGLASGIEILRFHGLGNEVEATRPSEFYRVKQARFSLDPRIVLPVGTADLSLGPSVRYASTERTAGRIIEALSPYGAGDFGQAGMRLDLRLDTRDTPAFASRGVTLSAGGSYYPRVWDVERQFGEARAEASIHVRGLALRAGGKRVWGTYPFHEAAFVGDDATARLGRQNRYGGDAAVWSNAELRMRVGKAELVAPATFGVFALGDVGRVFLKGESSTRWHGAAGGGVWVSFLRPANTLTLALARGAERTAVYVRFGFAY